MRAGSKNPRKKIGETVAVRLTLICHIADSQLVCMGSWPTAQNLDQKRNKIPDPTGFLILFFHFVLVKKEGSKLTS